MVLADAAGRPHARVQLQHRERIQAVPERRGTIVHDPVASEHDQSLPRVEARAGLHDVVVVVLVLVQIRVVYPHRVPCLVDGPVIEVDLLKFDDREWRVLVGLLLERGVAQGHAALKARAQRVPCVLRDSVRPLVAILPKLLRHLDRLALQADALLRPEGILKVGEPLVRPVDHRRGLLDVPVALHRDDLVRSMGGEHELVRRRNVLQESRAEQRMVQPRDHLQVQVLGVPQVPDVFVLDRSLLAVGFNR